MSDPAGATAGAVHTVRHHLDQRGIGYEVLHHDPTYSAGDEAQAAGVEPDAMVKTVVLRDGDRWFVAAIPATRDLDLARARAAMRASSHLRLATEDEIAAQFPQFEVGALPPLGAGMDVLEIFDIRLLYRERVACAGGDHRHSLLVDPRDLVRLAEPRVADVCRHDGEGSRFSAS